MESEIIDKTKSVIKVLQDDPEGTIIGKNGNLVIERSAKGELEIWIDPRNLNPERFKRLTR